jgi:hypothetical protein
MGKSARKCVQGFPKPSYLTSPFFIGSGIVIENQTLSAFGSADGETSQKGGPGEISEQLIYIADGFMNKRKACGRRRPEITRLIPRLNNKPIAGWARRQLSLNNPAGNPLWHSVTPPFVCILANLH